MIHRDNDSTRPHNRPSLVDLDDEELEHQFLRQGLPYPRVSAEGKPLFDANGNSVISDEERQEMVRKLEQKFAEVFDVLRIDRNDPNSTDSPFRLARMWVNELFAGRFTPPPRITVFPNRKRVDELVISRGIKVMHMCHRMCPT